MVNALTVLLSAHPSEIRLISYENSTVFRIEVASQYYPSIPGLLFVLQRQKTNASKGVKAQHASQYLNG